VVTVFAFVLATVLRFTNQQSFDYSGSTHLATHGVTVALR
jgi:hypothetical protein